MYTLVKLKKLKECVHSLLLRTRFVGRTATFQLFRQQSQDFRIKLTGMLAFRDHYAVRLAEVSAVVKPVSSQAIGRVKRALTR